MESTMRRLTLVAMCSAVVALTSAVVGWFGAEALSMIV
jgi:hypothetical protein